MSLRTSRNFSAGTPSSEAARRQPYSPPYQPGGELLGLPLSLGAVDPLPGLQVEARPNVQQVVAYGVGHVPPEPRTRQPRLHTDGPAYDDFLDPAPEREQYDLEPQLIGQPP